MAAIYDARKDEPHAKAVYKQLKALPAAEARASKGPAADPDVKAGASAFVAGSRINVRAAADAKAALVTKLDINTEVQVAELAGEWARLAPATSDTAATWSTGYVKASLLSSRPYSMFDATRAAAALEAQGDLEAALRLYQRARAMDAEDRTLWPHLLRLACATGAYSLAADMALKLAPPPEPEGPNPGKEPEVPASTGTLKPGERFAGAKGQEPENMECQAPLAAFTQLYGPPSKVSDEENGGEGFRHYRWQSNVAALVLICQGEEFNTLVVEKAGKKKGKKK
jgi:tetratricopeptide (TPR) repeat protein